MDLLKNKVAMRNFIQNHSISMILMMKQHKNKINTQFLDKVINKASNWTIQNKRIKA